MLPPIHLPPIMTLYAPYSLSEAVSTPVLVVGMAVFMFVEDDTNRIPGNIGRMKITRCIFDQRLAAIYRLTNRYFSFLLLGIAFLPYPVLFSVIGYYRHVICCTFLSQRLGSLDFTAFLTTTTSRSRMVKHPEWPQVHGN